jgi:hypothetical protein
VLQASQRAEKSKRTGKKGTVAIKKQEGKKTTNKPPLNATNTIQAPPTIHKRDSDLF